jgi:hypothetical protein
VAIAGALFFVWRQGQIPKVVTGSDGYSHLQADNPIGVLRWPLIATLGLLLQVSVAFLSWSAFAVLSLLSVAVYSVAWFALALVRTVLGIVGVALASVARLVRELFLLPAILAQRVLEVAAWVARWLGVAFAWLWANVLIVGAAAWAALVAVGHAIASAARWVGRGFHHLGRAIRAAAIELAAAIRAVAVGVWSAVTAVGRGIASLSRAIGFALRSAALAVWHATCEAITACAHRLKSLSASIWHLLKSPFRALEAIWNWICRFSWAKKIHFIPRGHKAMPNRREPLPAELLGD